MANSAAVTGHDDWLSTSWGNLVELKYGKALKDYRDSDGEYPVYGTNGPVGWCYEPLCDYPSVIVGRKGAYRGIHYSSIPFHVIDTAFYVRPKTDINLKWAYYALLLQDINGMDSGSAIPSTSRDDFYALIAKVPPRNVQDQIVQQLDVLNEKIELNRQMNETLEAMAKALFKSWFVDFDPVIDNALAVGNEIEIPEPLQMRVVARQALGDQRKPLPADIQSLFPDRFVFTEKMGWVPEGWNGSTVGEEFDVTMGQSPPGDTYNEDEVGIPFFQGRADFGFRFPSKRVYCTDPKRLATKGDTLVSVRAPVGDANIASDDCAIGRGVAALRHKSGSGSYTYYAMLQLSENFKVYEGEGTVFGSINQKDFKALPSLHMPHKVLDAFHTISSQLDMKLENNSCQISELSSIRDTLLPKLLSGELRIPDAEKHIAEVI